MSIHLVITNIFVYTITVLSIVVYYQSYSTCPVVVSPPEEHTNAYEDDWLPYKTNTNSTFFDSLTFGADLDIDPCKPLSSSAFRKAVNNRVRCTGKHCIKGKFSCAVGNSRDCYNVEHIFDRSRGANGYASRDIAANMVMAWGTWNQQMGGLSYTESTAEKSDVYGIHMERVRKAMDLCNDVHPTHGHDTMSNDMTIEAGLLILACSMLSIYLLTLAGKGCNVDRKNDDVDGKNDDVDGKNDDADGKNDGVDGKNDTYIMLDEVV